MTYLDSETEHLIDQLEEIPIERNTLECGIVAGICLLSAAMMLLGIGWAVAHG